MLGDVRAWVTADLHIGHRNIIEYCDRPFADVEEMNRALVDNWNDRVDEDDDVFVLGDLLLGNFDDSLAVVKRLRGNKVLITGNHERCLSSDTRVVTPGGFVHYQDLLEGDLVLSCDNDRNPVWLPIKEVMTYPFQGDMTWFRSNRFDGMVTPKHRVLILDQSKKRFVEWTGQQIADREFYKGSIVVGLDNRKPDLPDISDDMLRLLGWCLTDSSYQITGGSEFWVLYQRASNADKIRSLLNRLGLRYAESSRKRDITEVYGKRLRVAPEPAVTFRVSATETADLPFVGKIRVPRWCWDLSMRQFEVLWDVIVDADGSYASTRDGGSRSMTPDGNVSGVVYCGQEQLRDDLRLLLTVNGYSSSITVFRGNDYRLNFTRRTTCAVTPGTAKVDRVPYDGTVWCVVVENGRFFVERDGKIHLTGNSFRTSPARRARIAQRYMDDGGFAMVVPETISTLTLFRASQPGFRVLISHFPFPYADDGDDRGHNDLRPVDDGSTWLLHGHVHNRWKVRREERMINVGVDVWDYAPVALSVLAGIVGKGGLSDAR
jgi:calcineurin-like phosphoesterase family protein